MSRYPDLFVLRHGQTEWNVEGRYQGRQNSPLTDRGKAQARRQGEILTSLENAPARVFVSPLLRTVETARLAMPWAENTWTLDPRLQEMDFGAWEGRLKSDLQNTQDPYDDNPFWFFNSPGGESFEDMENRVRAFLNDMDAPAIIVTHGGTSGFLRGIYMGLPPIEMLTLPKDQGCVFHLCNEQETILR